MRSFLIILICVLISGGIGSDLVVSGDPGAPSYAKDLARLIGAIKWGGIGFFVGLIFVLVPRNTQISRFIACILAILLVFVLGWYDIRRSYDASRKDKLVHQISKGSVKLDSLVENWKSGDLPEWKMIGFYAGLMYGKPITNNNLRQLWLLCYRDEPKHRWIVERIIFYKNTPTALVTEIYTEYSKRPVPDELLIDFAKSQNTPTNILQRLINNPNTYVSSFAKENLEKRPHNTPLEPSR